MSGDYPEGRGRVRLEATGIEIEGVSIAGHESFYKLPGFHCLLEFGRAPDDTVGYATIFLSHAHLDHAAGLAHHASRRRLARLSSARVFAPAEAVADLGNWLEACERLEGIRYGVSVEAASPGESASLRNDLDVKFLQGSHRVPTVGYLFCEVRRKLRDEFRDLAGEEIGRLKGKGVEVTRREEIPLLAYPGDCGVEIFQTAPELFDARVLLIECSFLLPEDIDRARLYGHLHLEDFVAHADRFENEAIVLTHFSQRYRPAQILEALQRLPRHLAARVIPFLPAT